MQEHHAAELRNEKNRVVVRRNVRALISDCGRALGHARAVRICHIATLNAFSSPRSAPGVDNNPEFHTFMMYQTRLDSLAGGSGTGTVHDERRAVAHF